jgi:hypothetical protein
MDHPFARCFERRRQLANEDRYRLGLAQRFSYVLPEPHLVEVVKRYSPLVELGAGTGYWTYLLTSIGADVIAFDHAPLDGMRPNRYHPHVRPWAQVNDGDVSVLAQYSSRSLFMCWPPLYSGLWEALRFYKGLHIVYIGDSGRRTTRLGDLRRDFKLIEAHPAVAMDPAEGTHVELSVWRRLSRVKD